ncbi:MAG: hypothetical protein Q7T44_18540 [Parvibaculum sp.]|nr:hypothetical protein [Parvibaculum sp.]
MARFNATEKLLNFKAFIIYFILIGLSIIFLKKTSPVEAFNFELCRYSFSDSDYINEKVKKLYPLGSESKDLIDAIEGSSGYVIEFDNFEALDFKFDSDELFSASAYSFNCRSNTGYDDTWQVVVLENKSEEIHDYEISFSFDGENFASREIPFEFRYFWGKDRVEKALLSIVGLGRSYSDINNIFTSIGLMLVTTPVVDGLELKRYEYSVDNNSIIRRMGYYEDVVVLCIFDENEMLVSLEVI